MRILRPANFAIIVAQLAGLLLFSGQSPTPTAPPHTLEEFKEAVLKLRNLPPEKPVGPKKPAPTAAQASSENRPPRAQSQQQISNSLQECERMLGGLGKASLSNVWEQCRGTIDRLQSIYSPVTLPKGYERPKATGEISVQTYDHFMKLELDRDPFRPTTEPPGGKEIKAALEDVTSTLIFIHKDAQLERDLTPAQEAELGAQLSLLIEARESFRVNGEAPACYSKLSEIDQALETVFRAESSRGETPEQIFLGSIGDLPNSDRYRFESESEIRYLVKKPDSDTWIFVSFDKLSTSTSVRHYRIANVSTEKRVQSFQAGAGDQKILLKSIDNLKPGKDSKTVAQLEYGILIRGDRQDVGGKSFKIPQGVDIARANILSQVAGQPLSSELRVNQERASLNTSLYAAKDSSVGATVGGSCNIDGRWRSFAQLHIFQLGVGYQTDAKGTQYAVASLQGRRSFARVESDFDTNPTFSVGRAFKRGAGYIQASTNLDDRTAFSLILLIR